MSSLLSQLGADLRRSPLYAGLLGLGLATAVLLGLRGSRLLGDDTATGSDTEQGSAPRSGGHGGYVHGFNHK